MVLWSPKFGQTVQDKYSQAGLFFESEYKVVSCYDYSRLVDIDNGIPPEHSLFSSWLLKTKRA